MTNDEARQYFVDCGLSYDDIYEGDILVLVMLLNREIKRGNKREDADITSMYLSKNMILKKRPGGKLRECYLFMGSHYFKQRECISFNKDGFIGFAGWASSFNTEPILRAFIEWCDYMKTQKEI